MHRKIKFSKKENYKYIVLIRLFLRSTTRLVIEGTNPEKFKVYLSKK